MYLEKKKISGEVYNYLKISVRCGNKVRTKSVAYLGKGKLTKKDLNKIFDKYKNKSEEIKNRTLNELKQEIEMNQEAFLKSEQLKKIEQIKDDFDNKLKNLDEITKKDMFLDFITFYAYNTNAIEGNTFSLRDTELLLNKGITPAGKTLREVNDHLNAKDVFDFILINKPEINHEVIIKIHEMLMKNIDLRVGDYRKHNVRVIGARFDSSPSEYVKIDMGILLKWYKKEKNNLPPLILASIFHQKFEKIHPFYDGNGRTGRVILNLILMKNNLPPLIVPDAQRKRYYNSLSAADDVALDRIDKNHKDIVEFCYLNLLKTYNTIFSKWG